MAGRRGAISLRARSMIVGGTVRVPGDKSITHRALLLAGLARGTTYIGGALTSLDARSSARVLRQLGADVSPLRAAQLTTVRGQGRFKRAEQPLNCGNSGTTARLLLGALAGHRFPATLTGDRSLRRRPMRRVTTPLAQMGLRVHESAGDGLPLRVQGGHLVPLRWELPVSSAQIKSALLLAGVTGAVPVELREPHGRSRDHTERMLRSFGFEVEDRADGWIGFAPTSRIEPFDLQVPGDPSSAAFLVGTALLAEGGELRIAAVGLNLTRIRFLDVLARMGAEPAVHNSQESHGEPVGDIVVKPAPLRGTEVVAAEIPALIDEIPLLAALASHAEGETIFRQVGELRVKESDRLGLIASNLRAVGKRAEVQGEDLWIEGTRDVPKGVVRTDGDHRIAMAFAVLGTVPEARIKVDDMNCAAVSFPGFERALRSIRR